MNDLQVRVIETTPAVVNFNYQEISGQLKLILENYRGLVFTETTVQDCKKTIAELRKGQKSIDDFRKETKQKLTVSITAFEEQCKKLSKEFESVINPLTEQYEQFETDRKETKRKQILELIEGLIEEHGLTKKFASRLIFPDEYLNKGKSQKEITSELTSLATTLRTEQDKELQDIDLIRTKVELANAKYQLSTGLADGAYLSMLAHKPVDETAKQISLDAEIIRDRQIKEAKVETAAPSKVHTPFIPAAPGIPSTPPLTPVQTAPPEPAAVSTETYMITGTEAQLDALESFLNSNNFVWEYK